MRKLSAWFRSHPIVSTLLVLAALFTGTHFFLNWQSERRWQSYANEARARGVKLNLTEFAPPKIPDEENFAALPMMRAIIIPGARSPMALPDATRPGFGNPLKGEQIEWAEWGAFFKKAGFISETTDSAPRDVLRALEHYAPQFQEWSEWRTRKHCRFDLDYEGVAAMGNLPYLMFQDAALLFALRMRAHLALGETESACKDFNEGFQAYRTLLDESSSHSGYVRVAALSHLIDGVGDGLADNVWKEEDLKTLDATFTSVRVWNDYRSCMSYQRVFVNWMHDSCIGGPLNWRVQLFSGIGIGPPGPPPVRGAIVACIPRRFYRDNQLRSNRYLDEMLMAVSTDGVRFNPDQPMPSGPSDLSEFDEVFLCIFDYMTAGYGAISDHFARIHTKLDQARIAIAIERFQMERGTLPNTLPDLVPEFLTAIPDDVYGKGPMIYRRDEGKKSSSIPSVEIVPMMEVIRMQINPNRDSQTGSGPTRETDFAARKLFPNPCSPSETNPL